MVSIIIHSYRLRHTNRIHIKGVAIKGHLNFNVNQIESTSKLVNVKFSVTCFYSLLKMIISISLSLFN